MNIEFSPLCLGRLNKCYLLDELYELCDSVHLDYMDGKFVDNKAFSINDINNFKSNKPKHIHLMCNNPKEVALKLRDYKTISAHIETGDKFNEFMEYMILNKYSWGVAISPNTSLNKIFSLKIQPTRVLVMAVKPGYSGQPFLYSTYKRIKEINKFWPKVDLVIDGGMHQSTIAKCYSHKANSFVICTDLVRAKNKSEYVKKLKEKVF